MSLRDFQVLRQEKVCKLNRGRVKQTEVSEY